MSRGAGEIVPDVRQVRAGGRPQTWRDLCLNPRIWADVVRPGAAELGPFGSKRRRLQGCAPPDSRVRPSPANPGSGLTRVFRPTSCEFWHESAWRCPVPAKQFDPLLDLGPTLVVFGRIWAKDVDPSRVASGQLGQRPVPLGTPDPAPLGPFLALPARLGTQQIRPCSVRRCWHR